MPNEADTCRRFVIPKLQAAGWDSERHRLNEQVTFTETAEYLKVSRSTLYKLAQEGKLPGQKVGHHWRFRKAAIDEWLKQHPQKGART